MTTEIKVGMHKQLGVQVHIDDNDTLKAIGHYSPPTVTVGGRKIENSFVSVVVRRDEDEVVLYMSVDDAVALQDELLTAIDKIQQAEK